MSNALYKTFNWGFNTLHGLNKNDVRKRLRRKLNQNADLLIGIDDPELNELIDVLVEAIAEVIEENNRIISRKLNE